MPFSPNLNLELPNNGDYENVWDGPVNDNFSKIDDSLGGPLSKYSSPTPGGGHAHDGTPGEGPQIRHQDLGGAGTVPHSTLDTESGKILVSATDTVVNYLLNQLQAGSGVVFNLVSPGGDEKVEISASGVTPVLGNVSDPSGEYGWKHFVPTSAPVSYTDNFNYRPNTDLGNCDYLVTDATPGGTNFRFKTTGYSARVVVDPTNLASDTVGQYAAAVTCHIPHGRAQRTTLSITEADFTNLEVGDSISFTLSLHSTHKLGPQLPQKYGVLLEINAVKISTGPDVFQVSHKIWVIPDDTRRILLFQCNAHSNPADFEGCWELSMDSNGHVYHYWRRTLVYSSQTSPPNIPGPVQAYFNDLTTSLQTIGDPGYGAMGFGSQYSIKPSSRFSLECRWLSTTANSDEYDNVPAGCPIVLPPYGVVDPIDIPQIFFLTQPSQMGAECCDVPFSRKIGEIIQYDILGNPEVWITGCNELYNDLSLNGIIKGYTTNISYPWCFPCEWPPSGTPAILSPPANWPIEGTTGYILVHGIGPLPPVIHITSSTIGFVIISVVVIDLWEFIIKYAILDGYAGTDVDIEITHPHDPSLPPFTIPGFVTIAEATPVIDSIGWLDNWLLFYTEPTAGYEFDIQIHGSGFNTDAVAQSASPGVSVLSSNYVSPSLMVATVMLDFGQTRGQTIQLDVLNVAQGQTGSSQEDVAYPVPKLLWVDLSATTVGVGRTGTIYGNFFPSTVTVVPTVPALVTNFIPVYVDKNTITFTMDIIGFGGSQIDFQITDPDGGLSVVAHICVINDVAVPTISSVVASPLDVYEAGRASAYDVQVTGTNFGPTCYLLMGNLPAGPVYGSGGDVYTTSRTPTTVNGKFWVGCGSGAPAVDVSVVKPGVSSATALAAILTFTAPTLTITPGSAVWNNGLEPGAVGVVNFNIAVNLTHLTDISQGNPNIILTNRVVNISDVQYDYQIAADAPQGSIVQIYFTNGSCDGSPKSYDVEFEYKAPTFTSVTWSPFEDLLGTVMGIHGTGFRAGLSVGLVNMSLVSIDSIADTKVTITVDNGPPGAASVEVVNSDFKTTGIQPLTVLTEIAPDVDVAKLDPDVEGSIGATIRIWGKYLTPPGAAYAFTGLAGAIPVVILPNYLEFIGDISVAAGVDVTLDITSTSHSYPGIYLDTVTASPGGDVLISDLSETEPKENQTAFEMTINGQNLDQVMSVEFEAADPDALGLAYFPNGATIPITGTIIEKRPDVLVLSMDFEPGLAYNVFNIIFYDGGMGILAIAPNAFTVQPSDDAPVILPANRLILDGSIPTAALANWMALVKVSGTTPWMFGDNFQASGFTLGSVSYDSLNSEWSVAGTNLTAGTKWQLKLARPAVPGEEAIYRVPGGEVTP